MSQHRVRNEDGYALITAVVLMTIMVGIGLSLLGAVDIGQDRVREQRVRETALNLTEGVLFSQGFTLAATWPGNESGVMPPAFCTDDSTESGCPDADYLAAGNSSTATLANFANVDAALIDVEWETRVRDNGPPLTNYTTANADLAQTYTDPVTGASKVCAAPCRWDANGDKQLWVQAKATIQGRSRNVVALLRLEQLREAAPSSAVMSGGVVATNNGTSHLFVSAIGSQVVVRCNPSTADCATYRKTPTPQLNPEPTNPPGTPYSLLSSEQIARLKESARALGTYFPAGQCPSDLRGSIVFVENCALAKYTNSTPTAPCSPAPPDGMATKCINQSGKPGILIWQCGRMEGAGGLTFVGLVYMVNGTNGACPSIGGTTIKCEKNKDDNDVFTTNGGFGVWGAVAVDGNGCLKLGSNGTQIKYDPNVFNNLASFGTVGLVQNTWRELTPVE